MKLFKIFLLSFGLMLAPAIKTSPANMALGITTMMLSSASLSYWSILTFNVIKNGHFELSLDSHSVMFVARFVTDIVAMIAGAKLFFPAFKTFLSEYEKRKNAKTNSQEETTVVN